MSSLYRLGFSPFLEEQEKKRSEHSSTPVNVGTIVFPADQQEKMKETVTWKLLCGELTDCYSKIFVRTSSFSSSVHVFALLFSSEFAVLLYSKKNTYIYTYIILPKLSIILSPNDIFPYSSCRH